MLRVAVVGAGPAGIYAADELTATGDLAAAVDVIDRLPTPFGLLRYGVAPDHLKMKSLVTTLQRVLDRPQVHFVGGVQVGRDVTVPELRSAYDAVIYSFGAAVDRQLAIPGEQLAGSASSTSFVAWYSGHPDYAGAWTRLDASSVVVVGAGNVAVDVTRVLLKPADDLRTTDIPPAALAVLAASAVRDVHVLVRRGPAQAKWTTKELRELGDLAGVEVLVDPADLVLDAASAATVAAEPLVARNVEVLRGWSHRPVTGAPRRLHLHFWTRPVELVGVTGVEAVRVTSTRPGATAAGNGALVSELPAQLVLRAVGYLGVPVPDVPFDEEHGTIPTDAGRIRRDGVPSPGEYACGWIGRGPVGVLGTNKHDARTAVAAVRADAPGLQARPVPQGAALRELLATRGVPFVDLDGWAAIDAAEVALGVGRDSARIKIDTLPGLWAAAVPPR